MPHTLEVTSLKPGDVLLCYSKMTAEALSEATGSAYSHAAISLGGEIIAESAKRGIRKGAISELFTEFDHIAVFRQPDCWSQDRGEELKRFVEAAIKARAKFNFEGIKHFEDSHEAHQTELMDKVKAFFEGNYDAPTAQRDKYFCSEFVAACVIAVGILSPSAAVVYDPKAISPGALGNDGVYGFFAGYVVPDQQYTVPSEDEFIRRQPLHEWFSRP